MVRAGPAGQTIPISTYASNHWGESLLKIAHLQLRRASIFLTGKPFWTLVKTDQHSAAGCFTLSNGGLCTQPVGVGAGMAMRSIDRHGAGDSCIADARGME